MNSITITVRYLRSICRFGTGGTCHGKRICQHPANREPVLENVWSQCTVRRCPIVRRSNRRIARKIMQPND